MKEGVHENEVGLLEVFHCGEMIARVSNAPEAWNTYSEACARTTGKIREYQEVMARRS